jgi:predicted nucleotidyltransferase
MTLYDLLLNMYEEQDVLVFDKNSTEVLVSGTAYSIIYSDEIDVRDVYLETPILSFWVNDDAIEVELDYYVSEED